MDTGRDWIKLVALCGLLGLLASVAPAADRSDPAVVIPAPSADVVNPYVSLPNPYVLENLKEAELSKAEHLEAAIEHLKAAGEGKLAQQISRDLLIESKLEQIRKLQAEVDQLLAGQSASQTLMLQMKMIELQTSKMRELGFEFSEAGGSSIVSEDSLPAMLEALLSSKLAKVLAEPTLVTVSGRSASFQSGGEIPIIVPQKSDAVSVEYRQTGTRVDCIGTILDNGRIRLELSSTVSEVDAARSLEMRDISVPGLRTRHVDTAVEMDDGQTLVLCGALQEHESDDAVDRGRDAATSMLLVVTVHVQDMSPKTASQQPSLR